MTSFSPQEEVRTEEEQLSWLKRPIIHQVPTLSIETVIITLILILAVFSRFYLLGERVMSHDETNHVVPSYELSQGRGYRHDPITHGPFQFHIIALTYFMLGDSDFTSRLPAALFSVATVAFAWWGFRRYLGRTGALVAAFMMLISPYILFYGRYTRNEAFVGLSGLVMIYAILRYLETGRDRFAFLLTLTTVFHFIVKETAYIYTAQALLFLGGLFLYRVVRRTWRSPAYKQYFTICLLVSLVLFGAALVMTEVSALATPAAPPPPAAPAASPTPSPAAPAKIPVLALALGGVGALGVALSMFFLFKGYSQAALRQERSFDLLILLGTLILPLLAPFPVKILGWNPLDYSNTGILHTSLVLVPVILIAIAIGVWWRPRLWLANAALFYSIFIVFYTTFFTNGTGFLTGLIGSLGYWLEQQGVQRGSQPWYYFALIQIPIYEFLPALGTLAALVLALRHPELTTVPEEREEIPGFLVSAPDTALQGRNGQGEDSETSEPAPADEPGNPRPAVSRERVPVIALLLFWPATSLIAFSYAGEKMPWLTVHITLVMIMAAAWAFGYLIDSTPWKSLWERKGLLVLLLLPVFIASLAGTLLGVLGNQPPFQGNELVQLQNTATFLLSAITVLASGAALLVMIRSWTGFEAGRATAVVFFALLAVLTARAAIRASYIDYDTAKEYLVYAHAARGPKDVLADVEDISRRTTGDRSIAVAYDNESLYPYWWYFRNFPNHVWFADKPTRELRNNPIIIVGDANYSKIEPIVGNAYTFYETMRLWWPNQDYFNLTWERIRYALADPGIRAGIWQIWFNRDYTQYAKATNNQNLTLTTWVPSNKMRVYIRKDIASQIWKYGAAPAAPVVADPYEKGTIKLEADQVIGSPGNQPGQFDAPRGIALAQDGSLYVADSRNQRIQHLAADGTVIKTWGSFADANKGDAPGGTFNEPWDVAVGKDGSVFVADTWNNRIQKFTADGQFIKMWGYFGQAESPDAFWGPRGLAVNSKGQLLVTDTGNKRVVVFDPDGNFVTQFGSIGTELGQLDEPVGIAVDAQDAVYIADTWNQRIQVFTPDSTGTTYVPSIQWEISGWFGQSLDNKPYLAVDQQGHVFTSDPEGYRILEFTTLGDFVRTWGDNTTGADGFGQAAGVAVDELGNVWASDAGNMRIMHFPVPK